MRINLKQESKTQINKFRSIWAKVFFSSRCCFRCHSISVEMNSTRKNTNEKWTNEMRTTTKATKKNCIDADLFRVIELEKLKLCEMNDRTKIFVQIKCLCVCEMRTARIDMKVFYATKKQHAIFQFRFVEFSFFSRFVGFSFFSSIQFKNRNWFVEQKILAFSSKEINIRSGKL